jgi:NitT/TauT family transport system substrate-binding protein
MQPTARALPPIRVEYTQWWGDYTLLVAQEKGFFAEYGVEVEPAYYEIFSDAYPDLAAGQLDAALLSTGDAMSVNRYTPIQIIGLEDDGGYMPIVANPEIKSLVDLRGKSVGTLVGTQYELIVTEMLASAGMTTADITISNLDPEDIPDALANGEIQAGFTWEPYTSQAIKKGAHIIYPMNNTLRLLPDAIIFRQSVIDQRPQDVQAFMRAWFKAVDYRLNYPEETRQIAAKYIGVPVEQIEPDPSQKIFTYEDNLALFTQSSTEANSIFNVMQKNAAYLIFNGSLAIMPDVKSIVTPRFLLQK